MNEKEFSNARSGELVRVDIAGKRFFAFVPGALPPTFPLDLNLINALSAADRALGELAGVGRNITNPELLIKPLLRREAVLSSRIEGTQTDLVDLYAFEAGQRGLPGRNASSEADAMEVHNYVRASEFGLAQLETRALTLNLLCKLHEILLSDVRGAESALGEFRQLQNMIGGRTGMPEEARYIPPPVSKLGECLDALEKYINRADAYPPLVRLAFIHYQFEAIHPFMDGNGRIGRLLVSLLFLYWKLLPLPLLHLSAFFERNRMEYCDLLLAVSCKGEWKAWVQFFLQGVAEQAQDTTTRAKKLQDLQADWRARVQKQRMPVWSVGLVDFLFEHPFIFTGLVQKRFKVSHPTAIGGLRRLTSLGILKEYKLSSGSAFLAEEITRTVQ